MSQLFDKSMQTLELHRVLELLSACAVTEEGKERAYLRQAAAFLNLLLQHLLLK